MAGLNKVIVNEDAHATHAASHTKMADCPACLVKPGSTRSSKAAWVITALALVLLAAVLLFRPGTPTFTIAGGGGLFLLGALLCPLTMGAMMFMMMRKGH